MQISANGVSIEVDVQGPPDGEPLLLVMGLTLPLTAWPQGLVDLLLAHGFRVIRMDNRDTGLSQGFDHLGVPHVAWAALRYRLGLRVRSPYSLTDMAADALGVLDALGIERAHVCGASMGGMIVQHLAARHPARVKTAALIMTGAGVRRLQRPHPRVLAALLRQSRGHGTAQIAAGLQRVLTLAGSPVYPTEPAMLRAQLEAMVDRGWHANGGLRQLVAIAADGDRSALLPRITAPTLVIHGQDDPLVPAAAGRHLAQHIAGAAADFIPGMGHDLPQALWPRLADALAANARRAGARSDVPS